MADFLNKLKKSIDKGTQIVSAKSNTLIETNKLKSDIATLNRGKKEILLALGKKVYEQGKAGTFDIASVEGMITQISDAEAKVVDLEAKIVKIQTEEKEKMAEINKEGPVEVKFEEVPDEDVAEEEEQ